jgi:hypothetical protein
LIAAPTSEYEPEDRSSGKRPVGRPALSLSKGGSVGRSWQA